MTEQRPVHDNDGLTLRAQASGERKRSDLEQVEQAQASTAAAGMPAVPMPSIWRTIRNYVLWSYERGSIHYDIMVTLILLFIFVTPLFVNFKDKPVEHGAHPMGVLVIPDGQNGFIYQVPAAAVPGRTEAAVRGQLEQIIEPIAGPARISNYEKTRDAAGDPVYRVWLKK